MGPKSRSGGVQWGGDRLCQTSPIPRSPDGDNKQASNEPNTRNWPILIFLICLMEFFFNLSYSKNSSKYRIFKLLLRGIEFL